MGLNIIDRLKGKESAPTDTQAADDTARDEIHALRERITRLEEQVDLLTHQISTLENTREHGIASQQKKEADTVPPMSKREKTLYLAAPTSDGLFTSASQKEISGTSIYILTTEDGQTGEFSLLDNADALATAMISVSQFIKPACKAVNCRNVMPRTIVTESQGQATFDGEKWKVTRKATVRFIE